MNEEIDKIEQDARRARIDGRDVIIVREALSEAVRVPGVSASGRWADRIVPMVRRREVIADDPDEMARLIAKFRL